MNIALCVSHLRVCGPKPRIFSLISISKPALEDAGGQDHENGEGKELFFYFAIIMI